MSAIVSMVHAHGVHLFTDRAVWAHDQRLVDIRYKATTSADGRLAVSTTGDADLGRAIARDLCDRADVLGAEAAIDGLQDYADDVARQVGVRDGLGATNVVVAAYIPGRGGVHRVFRTYPHKHDCAYDVAMPAGSVYWTGAAFKAEDLPRHGLTRRAGERDGAYVRRLGVGIIGVMRYRRGRSREGGPLDIWCVGGGIDCTSLLHSGARVERLKTWPEDRVGSRIVPVAA